MSRHARRRWRGLVTRLVVISMVAGGVAVTQPAQAQAVPASSITLLASGDLPAAVVPNSDQRDGLEELSRVALNNVLARHGLADTPDERARMLNWNRLELRAELYALISAAAAKPFSQQTSPEAQALAWLGDVQERKNVLAAQAALDEYRAFYGSTAFTSGVYPQNACTYKPPAPFEDQYPGGPKWIGCTGPVPIIDLGPRIPSAEEFTRWGLAKTEATLYSGADVVLSGEAFRVVVGLAAAAAVIGAAGSVYAALTPAALTSLVLAFFPYTVVLPVGAPAAAVEAAATILTGSAGLSAAAVAAVVVTVVVAVALIVMAIIQAVQAAEVGPKLLEQLANAQSTPVSGQQVLASSTGPQTAFWAIQQLTTEPELASVTDVPQPPSGTGAIEVRDSSGALLSRTNTLNMVTIAPSGNVEALRREFRGGWWVDPAANPSAPLDQRVDPTMWVPAMLWDPNPRVSGNVLTDRTGFSYQAEVTTVFDQGRLRWRASVLGREGFPKLGTGCTDFHVDGCLITDDLPLVLDATGSVPPRRFARIVANSFAGDLTLSKSATTITAGDTFTVTAGLPGPGLLDGNGDPVTLAWQFTKCPSLVCLVPSLFTTSGTTATVTLKTPGAYTFKLTATDSLGAQKVATIDFVVANTAPTITAGLLPFTGRSVNLVGQVVDIADFPTPRVSVDWGDGSPITEQLLLNQGDFSLVHTYAAAGTYTATVTGSDGQLTATKLVTVRIAGSAPQIRVTAQTPASWADVAPGTRLRASGSVDDADTDEAITVRAEWYDGTQETLSMPAGSSRDFAFSHIVTAWTLTPATPLLRLTAVDPTNQSGSASVNGTVADAAPVFPQLVGTAAVAGSASRVSGTATDANRDAVTVQVDWGDGTSSPATGNGTAVDALAAFGFDHVYATAGSYTVTIRASSAGPSGRVDTTRQLELVVESATPGEVSGLTVNPGTGSAQVSWTAPTFTGGAPLTGYRVTATPPASSVTPPVVVNVPAGTTSTTVSGLAGGVPWTIAVAASNAVGAGPVATATVTPWALPGITGTPPATTVAGQPYSFAFAVSGSPAPVVSLASGALPTGLSLSADGKITGTPTVAGSGTFTVKVVNDAGPAVTASQTITVLPAAPAELSVSGGDVQQATAGQPFGSPLAVTVRDEFGNVVPGRSVTFTVTSGSARFGGANGTTSATAVTDATGTATVTTLTAGRTAGSVTVTAALTGASTVPPAVFALSVLSLGSARADLRVSVAAPATAFRGSTFTATVRVTNAGPNAAGTLVTGLDLPSGFSVVSARGGDIDHGGREVAWSERGLAVGATVTYTVTIRVRAEARRNARVLSVKAVSIVADPDLTNNRSTATVRVS